MWRDGTRALLLEPDDLIARLVVPQPVPDVAATKPPPARGDQLALLALLGETDDAPAKRKRWAWLLAHVFAADLESCPRCSGPMCWAEVATSRSAITRVLSEHGLGPRAPPVSRTAAAAPPEQMQLPFAVASR